MMETAPRIGFDRYIQLDWVAAALSVRAGTADLDELNILLDAARLSLAAKKKTITVLNRLWLQPRPELSVFADRGIEIYKANPAETVTALAWGMAMTTYAFFGRVAEFVGRLSTLQGDCSAAEVHRRMSEIYGEREGTYRMTNMVLQSQASWGVLERTGKGKRLIRLPPQKLANERVGAWLVEAALRYHGKAIAPGTLRSTPVLYPFTFDESFARIILNSETLELRLEGTSQPLVSLRANFGSRQQSPLFEADLVTH